MEKQNKEKTCIIKQRNDILFDKEFVEIIFLARIFIKYFYKSYFELIEKYSNEKIFFEHT
ncbi:hypothetical protein IKS57_01060 [bacterium]|nr:hypothetical protein [bacterium]